MYVPVQIFNVTAVALSPCSAQLIALTELLMAHLCKRIMQ